MSHVLAGFGPDCTSVAWWLHGAFMVARPVWGQPGGMDDSRSPTAVVAEDLAPGSASRGVFLGGEPGQQAGYRCLGCGQVFFLPLLEAGIQAIQLSPYHADLPSAPPRTPGHGRRFPGMLLSPSPFGSWVSH